MTRLGGRSGGRAAVIAEAEATLLKSEKMATSSDRTDNYDECSSLSAEESWDEADDDNESSEDNNNKKWTCDEDERLLRALKEIGRANWKEISKIVQTRSNVQCRQRWQNVLCPGLQKGKWTPDEDEMLVRVKQRMGPTATWSEVARLVEGRTSKQCRERWCHHLNPSVTKTPFSPDEDNKLVELYRILGKKWSKIASMLPGRTENSVRSRLNFVLRNRRGDEAVPLPVQSPGFDNSKKFARFHANSMNSGAAAAVAMAIQANNSGCESDDLNAKLGAQTASQQSSSGSDSSSSPVKSSEEAVREEDASASHLLYFQKLLVLQQMQHEAALRNIWTEPLLYPSLRLVSDNSTGQGGCAWKKAGLMSSPTATSSSTWSPSSRHSNSDDLHAPSVISGATDGESTDASLPPLFPLPVISGAPNWSRYRPLMSEIVSGQQSPQSGSSEMTNFGSLFPSPYYFPYGLMYPPALNMGMYGMDNRAAMAKSHWLQTAASAALDHVPAVDFSVNRDAELLAELYKQEARRKHHGLSQSEHLSASLLPNAAAAASGEVHRQGQKRSYDSLSSEAAAGTHRSNVIMIPNGGSFFSSLSAGNLSGMTREDMYSRCAPDRQAVKKIYDDEDADGAQGGGQA